MSNLRVILIGGTSHTGKSTLAQSLAHILGWSTLSTDKLGRHPGRPWRNKPDLVPHHVADHYLSLKVEELLADVLRHYYENIWPIVKSLVKSHASHSAKDCLVLEGSALWPEWAATVKSDTIAAIWLTANSRLLEERIYVQSQYIEKSPREREMIDKFLKRTLIYNTHMMQVVNRLELPHIEVNATNSLDQLSDNCLALLENR